MPIELEVSALSDDLRGLVRYHGKVGFVPAALPGETVRVEVARRHRRFDEYRLLAVVTPAAGRVRARCPLVGECGGCDLQHVAAPMQLRYKAEAVLAQLERVAGLVPVQVEEPIVSPPFGYRRRARLAVYVPRRGAPRVGFRELAGRRVVDVARCPVLAAELAELPGALAALLRTLRRPAAVGHLELTVSESASGASAPLVHVHAAAEPVAEDLEALAALGRSRQGYASVRMPDGTLHWLAQPAPECPGYLLPEFGLRLEYQPGDFLQGNAAVNRQLVSRVVGWLTAAAPAPRVLEGFCGIGNFSLPLARRGVELLALEGAPAMVERARGNAAANGVQVAVRQQDLTTADAVGMTGYDSVLLDPPRTGAAAFVQAAADAGARNVLYVSCAPATLARDAAHLASAGFRLSRFALVDMLPQTSHIECMALFQR